MSERFLYRTKKQDLASADLTLEATVQEGFEIMDIGIDGGAAGLVAQLFISSELMTGLPAASGLENVVPIRGVDVNTFELLTNLRSAFPNVPTYKVAAGEKFVLTSAGAAGVAHIFYRELVGDQIPKNVAPGGSNSRERLFVSHGKIEASVGIGLTVTLSVPVNLNPVGILTWPFTGVVPANQSMEVLAIMTRKGAGSGANIAYNGFRLWKLNSAILSPSEAFVDPAVFPYPSDGVVQPGRFFPKPWIFKGNEDMRIEANVTNSGGGAETAQIFFTFFILQKILS